MKKLSICLFLSFFLLLNINAFQFTPLEQVFSPEGVDSAKSYTIVNDSADTIAINLKTLTRDIDLDGKEINTDASRYFSIVPSKVLVKPNASQIVRVQYRGPKTVTSEMAFRLVAEQIPYSTGRTQTNQSMFNFLYIYTTSLYVVPSKTVPNVKIGEAVPFVAEDGSKMIKVSIANTGNIHQLLVGAEMTIVDTQGNRVFLSTTDQIPGIIGANILAKRNLVKYIPWPDELPWNEEAVLYSSISYSK